VIGGIIVANAGVYGAWQFCDRRWLTAHFSLSPGDVLNKPHTLLTSFFSHRDGWHLLGNMVTLFFFGPEVVYAVGARAFLGLYLGAGTLSNACEVAGAWWAHRNRNPYWGPPKYASYVGASGAVNAAVVWSVLLNPFRLIFVFAEFLPLPLPAILYGGAFVAKDVAALFHVHVPFLSSPSSDVAHGAHVAGAAYGALHFLLFRRRPRW